MAGLGGQIQDMASRQAAPASLADWGLGTSAILSFQSFVNKCLKEKALMDFSHDLP